MNGNKCTSALDFGARIMEDRVYEDVGQWDSAKLDSGTVVHWTMGGGALDIGTVYRWTMGQSDSGTGVQRGSVTVRHWINMHRWMVGIMAQH